MSWECSVKRHDQIWQVERKCLCRSKLSFLREISKHTPPFRSQRVHRSKHVHSSSQPNNMGKGSTLDGLCECANSAIHNLDTCHLQIKCIYLSLSYDFQWNLLQAYSKVNPIEFNGVHSGKVYRITVFISVPPLSEHVSSASSHPSKKQLRPLLVQPPPQKKLAPDINNHMG